MSGYDFDSIVERKNTASLKWDWMRNIYGREDLLPMWVADTDFLSPPEIIEALQKRTEHGVFGYGIPPKTMFSAVTNWVEKRYGWKIKESWLIESPGVVTALAFAIQGLTEEGDKVLIQTPVYPPFYTMIKNNNREIVKNPLKYINGRYEIDFADFEEKLKSGVKLFILCSPHNPVGRVWTEDELEKMGELCKKYNVFVVSDEIHADIIFRPNVHTPLASLAGLEEMTVTCIAPSKTFNIPGLQASVMIIPNAEIRKKITAAQGKIGYSGNNILGRTAMEAAYTHGKQWLEQLIEYLKGNRDRVIGFISRELPDLHVVPSEGTYLLWIDCRKLGLSDIELKKRLVEKGKLALEPGTKYGEEGTGFVRMNIGCPRKLLEEGLIRLKNALV